MPMELNKKICKLSEVRIEIEELLSEIEELVDEVCEDEEDRYLVDSFRPQAQGVRMVLSRYIVRLNERSMSKEMSAGMEKAVDAYKRVVLVDENRMLFLSENFKHLIALG